MEGFDERKFFCSISIESLSLKVVKTKILVKCFWSLLIVWKIFTLMGLLNDILIYAKINTCGLRCCQNGMALDSITAMHKYEKVGQAQNLCEQILILIYQIINHHRDKRWENVEFGFQGF